MDRSAARRRIARFSLATGLATALALGGTAPAGAAPPNRWEIVAHRGGVVAAPEHTTAAFTHAIKRGADSIEVDVRFTRGGLPVVFHDTLLDRTTDCRGAIASLNLKSLRRCDAGSWFSREFAGLRVPTLSQALAFIDRRDSGMRYYLHLKGTGVSQAKRVLATVRKRGIRSSKVVVISSSQTGLAAARQAGAPNIGYVFNSPAGWDTRYKWLIPYNVTLNDAVLAAAKRRGQRVLPVQNHPHPLGALAALDLHGVLADDLDKALIVAGRLTRVPQLTEVRPGLDGPHEPAAPEGEIAPGGPSRTTGPNDF